jgi:glycosyl transferase family 25
MKKKYQINDDIDQVYVVTVKKFKERIKHIKQELPKHGIRFKFFYEHDTPNLAKDTQSKFNIDLKYGYKANVLQHIALWKDAVKNNYERILILEDDVILHKNFSFHFARLMHEIKKLPADYIVFLGGADTKVPEKFFLTKGLLYPLPIATSEGLVMDLSGIKRRLKWVSKNKIHCPIDHLIAYIDKSQKSASYWSKISLTEQASIIGKMRSELDSHRLKHSEFFNKCRYYWNKFQRRQFRFYIVNFKHQINLLRKKLISNFV